jgi:glycosyltransferase involved in cell wall biosynthesis
MKNKFIYVLHKSGANNHYTGLEELCKQKGYQIQYREFSVVGSFVKSITKLKPRLFSKQITNASFLNSLSKNKDFKVILGIAPYDYKLPGLLKKLESHQVYYHTSWTSWDGGFYPNKKHVNPKLIAIWKEFIEHRSKHIFAVSAKTKAELVENYEINEDKISVVYHSLDEKVFNSSKSQQNLNSNLEFIYAGRLIPNKGLEELLEFFAQNPDKKFRIAGKGKLSSLIEDYVKKHSNIEYLGQITNRNELATYFGQSHYLILNSKKSGKWEELFGMVLIEAMACGAIPIATNHTGPQEIITHQKNGFLVEENQMIEFLNGLSVDNYNDEMKENAIQSAQNYSLKNISKRWEAVFKD